MQKPSGHSRQNRRRPRELPPPHSESPTALAIAFPSLACPAPLRNSKAQWVGTPPRGLRPFGPNGGTPALAWPNGLMRQNGQTEPTRKESKPLKSDQPREKCNSKRFSPKHSLGCKFWGGRKFGPKICCPSEGFSGSHRFCMSSEKDLPTKRKNAIKGRLIFLFMRFSWRDSRTRNGREWDGKAHTEKKPKKVKKCHQKPNGQQQKLFFL